MKKSLLTLAAAMVFAGAAADTTTINFTSVDTNDIVGTFEETQYNEDESVKSYARWQPLTSIASQGFTLTFEQNTSTTAPALYTTKSGVNEVRIYKGKDGGLGNTMTVTAPEGSAFKSIVFTNSKNLPNDLPGASAGELSGSEKTLTWSSDEAVTTVTFNSNATLNFTEMTISTEAAENPGVDPEPDPTLPEGAVVATLLQDQDATDWTLNVDSESAADILVWSWKVYSGAYYLNGSAYANGSANAAVAYAVSPVYDLTAYKDLRVTFEHAAKFQTTLRTGCKFLVREEGTNEWTEFEAAPWPEAGDWWKNAATADINISEFNGKKVQIGFKYVSTDEGADTWEIRDLYIYGVQNSGVGQIELNGNSILTEGAEVYSLNGVRVAANDLQKGIYVVRVNGKAVKVAIR